MNNQTTSKNQVSHLNQKATSIKKVTIFIWLILIIMAASYFMPIPYYQKEDFDCEPDGIMCIKKGWHQGLTLYDKLFFPKVPESAMIQDQIETKEKNVEDIPLLTTVAQDLEVPWALAFLPDGSILVTERAGRVRLVDKGGQLNPNPIAQIEDVRQLGEGGLHGIALHPNFLNNHFIYVYYTYGQNIIGTQNRVVRFRYEDGALIEKTIIVDTIPGALFHDGGRIKFGPDKMLYITTGDAQNPSLAQDINSLAGKILRVTDDGKPAPKNPFNNLVYSYGHRNPQGITWDTDGRLWETEHGSTATDEVNLIEIGKNYGWPEVRGDQERQGMESPILHSGSDTWAPAGAAYLNGSIFFAGLRGQALYEAVIKNNNEVELKEHFKGEFGRIREVIVGPDNMLYITTSNRDGRGKPDVNDDKIIRVNPTKL